MKPETLKAWRTKNGYTQETLAQALKVHRVTVGKWEAGMTEIPSFLELALKCLKKNQK